VWYEKGEDLEGRVDERDERQEKKVTEEKKNEWTGMMPGWLVD